MCLTLINSLACCPARLRCARRSSTRFPESIFFSLSKFIWNHVSYDENFSMTTGHLVAGSLFCQTDRIIEIASCIRGWYRMETTRTIGNCIPGVKTMKGVARARMWIRVQTREHESASLTKRSCAQTCLTIRPAHNIVSKTTCSFPSILLWRYIRAAAFR